MQSGVKMCDVVCASLVKELKRDSVPLSELMFMHQSAAGKENKSSGVPLLRGALASRCNTAMSRDRLIHRAKCLGNNSSSPRKFKVYACAPAWHAPPHSSLLCRGLERASNDLCSCSTFIHLFAEGLLEPSAPEDSFLNFHFSTQVSSRSTAKRWRAAWL